MLSGQSYAVLTFLIQPDPNVILFCNGIGFQMQRLTPEVIVIATLDPGIDTTEILRRINLNPDRILAVFIRHYLELEKNAVTVYNTFQTEEIKRKAQLPCDVAFDLNRMNLVTVSRIENEVKGTGRIAPICQLLKERYPGRFHWYVVGGGRDLECCKSQAEALDLTDHLTFLGPRNNPFPVLAKADLCVLTTFTEAYPMVIGESLILGVPAVTTRYPAAEEIILDGCNGIIADQSIESVFEKISQLFDDRDLYSEIKKTCELFEYDNDRSYKQFWESIGL